MSAPLPIAVMNCVNTCNRVVPVLPLTVASSSRGGAGGVATSEKERRSLVDGAEWRVQEASAIGGKCRTAARFQ